MAERERNRTGGAPPKGPRLSITLIPLEISKGEIKVLATLTNSATERRLRFVFNNIVQGTDAYGLTSGGKVEHIFRVPPGTEEARLKVETLGEPRVYDEITVVIPPETEEKRKEEKKFFDLELKAEGENGKWFINATIADEKGNGVKGVIRILATEGRISPSGRTDEDFSTDDHGTCLIELEFDERQKTFRFLVLGTIIDKTLRLAGPKKKLFPPYQAPEPEDLTGGILNAFRAGWRGKKSVEEEG